MKTSGAHLRAIKVGAGHDVIVSAKHRENAKTLAMALGQHATIGTP